MHPAVVIAVVIPSFKVKAHILSVIGAIPQEVSWIFVVDDACPEGSGDHVERNCDDPRVVVVRHAVNVGVGGAVMTGYRAAIERGVDIIVKVDGDGQMDPALLPEFVAPIAAGQADYSKGNRFFDLESIHGMPRLRLFGNAALSFLNKISSGYWDLFDPTNGYTAIHASVARRLPFDKISQRYFFESDMLFRLNTLRALVVDVPMDARYGDEVSNLRISRVLIEFSANHIRNFSKRIFYNYYLRDMSVASIELPLGLGMLLFGLGFGGSRWIDSMMSGQPSTSGTVMLSALPVFLGLQLLLSFLGYDIATQPKRPFHRTLRDSRIDGDAGANHGN